jgi:CRISPR-associated protein Csx14
VSFRVHVEATNPGQFFACCGLLELASRLDHGAVARFSASHFSVTARCSLTELLDLWIAAPFEQLDEDDATASPLQIPLPFGLRLDWWKDSVTGGRDLKVWAGTMQSARIAHALLMALRDPQFHTEEIFDVGCVVQDPSDPSKKVEPFYFDARRAPNAHSRDVGFSPNDLDLTTTASPAVEVLCLVGLQRCRPRPTTQRRVFEYCTWTNALPISVLAPVVAGAVHMPGVCTYRFENWFRTGQKKHKTFRPAILVEAGE